MRLSNAEYLLLKRICEVLNDVELKNQLQTLIERFEREREKTRSANKQRASDNRKAGYKWNSSYNPKKSRYKED